MRVSGSIHLGPWWRVYNFFFNTNQICVQEKGKMHRCQLELRSLLLFACLTPQTHCSRKDDGESAPSCPCKFPLCRSSQVFANGHFQGPWLAVDYWDTWWNRSIVCCEEDLLLSSIRFAHAERLMFQANTSCYAWRFWWAPRQLTWPLAAMPDGKYHYPAVTGTFHTSPTLWPLTNNSLPT